MKKIILFLLMLLPLYVWAQEEKFSIDKNGYGVIESKDNAKFIVKGFPNISAVDLYKAVGLGIEKNGQKDKIINSIEGTSIAVEDTRKYVIKVQKEFYGKIYDIYYDVRFKMIFEFKDEKVRIGDIKILSYSTDFTHVDKREKRFDQIWGGLYFKMSDEEIGAIIAPSINSYISSVLKEVTNYAEW